MMYLRDKVAIVTGGARGLGRSFVEILLKNGAQAALKTAGSRVRVNVLCPWFVDTSLMPFLNSEEQIGDFTHFKDVKEKLLAKRGILETDDVAKAFLTLVTDESKNGEVIFVDADTD